MSAFQLSKDINKNKVFLVGKSQLMGRLDPLFYIPSQQANIERIKKSQYPFDKVRHLAKRVVDGPFGSDLKVDEYVEQGIPLLRVGNIKTGEIAGNLVYITKEKQQQLKRSIVYPGDVVLTKAGAILGYSAVFPENLKSANITSHLVTITCTDNIIPEYLSVFFKTSFGQQQIYRWGNKSTRPELNTSEVKEILVPIPPKKEQQQVIDLYWKGREAKKAKDQQAEELLATIDNYLLDELEIELPEKEIGLEKRIFKVPYINSTGMRWDAFFHQDYFTRTLAAIEQGKFSCHKLSDTINGHLVKGRLPKAEEKDGICQVVQISSINSDGSIDIDDLLTSQDIFTKEQSLIQNDILVVITGATIGKIAFWDIEGDFKLGGDIVKFQTNEMADPYFVFNYLLSEPAQIQIKRNITGATNGHLAPIDVKHMFIPLPPIDKQKKIADHIRQIRQQAKTLQKEADNELTKASKEVEQIILGQ